MTSRSGPRVTYRQAGDRFLLVEYGEMEFELELNFLTLTVFAHLRAEPPAGVEDVAPGFRSLLIRYDPLTLDASRLIAAVAEIQNVVPDPAAMTLPSRLVHLPIAFDDSQSRQAVARYERTVRAEAPNNAGGSNIDYLVRYNGLAGPEELFETVLGTDWWTGFLGFFPGLPFLFPLDPRCVLSAPKYNPTRIWTPGGSVGLGGPCLCIYSVESPGGYQLFGRSLPVYAPPAGGPAAADRGVLLRPGDRIRFHRVEEDELAARSDAVRAGRYAHAIEDGAFRVAEHAAFARQVGGAAAERRRRHDAASAAAPVP